MGSGLVRAIAQYSNQEVLTAMRDLQIIRPNSKGVETLQRAKQLPRYQLVRLLSWLDGSAKEIMQVRAELVLLGEASSVEAAKIVIKARQDAAIQREIERERNEMLNEIARQHFVNFKTKTGRIQNI